MFKEIILNSQETIKKTKIIKRDIFFDKDILNLNKIITFVGPRRAGKTYFMYQIIKDLLKDKYIEIEQLVFIDFSEIIEKKINFLSILENYYEIYPNLEPFFVFDEIQEIDNFKEGILSLFNKWFKIFLSGSNANLLSKEIATQFRWRYYEIYIFPLSFKEFLKFQNISYQKHNSTKKKWLIKPCLHYWMLWGMLISMRQQTHLNKTQNLLLHVVIQLQHSWILPLKNLLLPLFMLLDYNPEQSILFSFYYFLFSLSSISE